MIRGVVNARCEAMVRLRLKGPSGVQLEVDAVVDTGFTSSLTLPSQALDLLGLARQSGSRALLADGSVLHFDVYAAAVEWDGGWLPIMVSAVGEDALIGMQLLAGHKLAIEVVPGGLVEITPLS
jgi:clan AA aspartic protease